MMRAVLRGLLFLSLAGCAVSPPPDLHGPEYFSDRTQPDVVLGYFTDPRLLDRKGCLDQDYDPDSMIDYHCVGPNPSVVLVVQDVIFGHLEHARWELSTRNVEHADRFPLGRRQPVLAYPERYGVISGTSMHRLFRTRAGAWALAVGAESDMPWLPCSSEQFLKPHPIEFAKPTPSRALDEYEEEGVEELRANPHVTLRDGRAHVRAGILLSDIYALRDRLANPSEPERLEIDACLRK
jgi:hypothetical protein